MGMCVVIRLVAWGGDVLSEGGWDGTGDISLPGGPGILMARHGTTNDRSTARLPRDSEPPRGCGQPRGHPEGEGFHGHPEGVGLIVSGLGVGECSAAKSADRSHGHAEGRVYKGMEGYGAKPNLQTHPGDGGDDQRCVRDPELRSSGVDVHRACRAVTSFPVDVRQISIGSGSRAESRH